MYVNDAFTQMTGYSFEEVQSKTPRLLQGPKTDRAVLNKIRAALKAWLEGRGEVPVDFAALAPVQGRAGRHGAVLLPFDELIGAMTK